jgi:hypothetical protein
MCMPEFDARLRKVGDSVGILIPHKVVEELGAQLNQTIHVVLPQRMDWRELWGRFRSGQDTGRLLRSARTRRD